MSRLRFMAVLAAALLCVASTLATWAILARYSVAGAGGQRYYSVILMDRWTGETWRLDNTGRQWNVLPSPVARPASASAGPTADRATPDPASAAVGR